MFNGNCKEAMEFYKSVMGGELKTTPYQDAPDKVMHASLENGTLSFMASDEMDHNPMPANPPIVGDNVKLSIAGDDSEKITGIYNKLSEGGEVYVQLAPAPWGDKFGMLKDKYGIHWMFNISSS